MTEYLKFLTESAAAAQVRATALQDDGRRDEANFEKVRCNVFDICKTIYAALQRNDAQQLTQRYPEKLNGLCASWQAAYDKAKAHDDVQRMMIEEIKLKTLNAIRQKYSVCRRDAYAGG